MRIKVKNIFNIITILTVILIKTTYEKREIHKYVQILERENELEFKVLKTERR